MKRIINSKLFLVLITVIIVGSIGVYAGTRINASEITYTNSNNEEITVDTALDSLYTEANKNILTRLNLSSSKISYNETSGIRETRSTTVPVTQGSYIVFIAINWTQGTNVNNSGSTDIGTLSYDTTKGQCTRHIGRIARATATTPVTTNSWSVGANTVAATYTCQFNANTNLTAEIDGGTSQSQQTNTLLIQAIKLD